MTFHHRGTEGTEKNFQVECVTGYSMTVGDRAYSPYVPLRTLCLCGELSF